MTPEAGRIAERHRKNQLLAEERRGRARDFAARLAAEFGAADGSLRAVIGFGSTFETWRNYRLDSDIDLALRGGDWGMLWSMIPRSEFDVSLIELDLQPDAFVEQVLAKGVVLYEKQ